MARAQSARRNLEINIPPSRPCRKYAGYSLQLCKLLRVSTGLWAQRLAEESWVAVGQLKRPGAAGLLLLTEVQHLLGAREWYVRSLLVE